MPSMNTKLRTLENWRADGVHQVQGEAGEGGHRAGDVGDDHDLGLGRARVAELGLGRHPAVGQRVAHGAAEVERALAPVAALAGQAHRQLAGQRAGAPCAATTSSSRVACMTSMSSGSGLRSDLARASAPRSATSRRRISVSISRRSWSMPGLELVPHQALLEVGQRAPRRRSPRPARWPPRDLAISRSSTPSRSRFRRVRYR